VGYGPDGDPMDSSEREDQTVPSGLSANLMLTLADEGQPREIWPAEELIERGVPRGLVSELTQTFEMAIPARTMTDEPQRSIPCN
jgi:hypothetical protein